MFEKEAEEYADGFKIPIQPKYCISKYFKDGAEFGYNKANEEAMMKLKDEGIRNDERRI